MDSGGKCHLDCGVPRASRWIAAVNQTAVLFTALVTRRLERKNPVTKHSDGLQNSSGKGAGYDHRQCESFDNGNGRLFYGECLSALLCEPDRTVATTRVLDDMRHHIEAISVE